MVNKQTELLRLPAFAQGDTPAWIGDIAPAMQAIDAFAGESGIWPYVHAKTGTVHQLNGQPGAKLIKFQSAGDFLSGDSFVANGAAIPVVTAEEKELPAYGIVNGSFVIAALMGGKLVILNRSYDKELTNINTALSNKVEQINFVSQEQFDNLANSKSYFGSVGPDIIGQPKASFSNILAYNYADLRGYDDARRANGAQELFYIDGDRYYRKAANGVLGKWHKIATAEPPQEFNLPLESGVIAAPGAKYIKSQESIVHVYGSVCKFGGAVENNTILFTMPPGFRPSTAMNFLAVFYPIFVPGFVTINPNGTAVVRHDGSTNQDLVIFSFSYLAKS